MTKEGWVNITGTKFRNERLLGGFIYKNENDAIETGKAVYKDKYIATVKIIWEE